MVKAQPQSRYIKIEIKNFLTNNIYFLKVSIFSQQSRLTLEPCEDKLRPHGLKKECFNLFVCCLKLAVQVKLIQLSQLTSKSSRVFDLFMKWARVSSDNVSSQGTKNHVGVQNIFKEKGVAIVLRLLRHQRIFKKNYYCHFL